MISIQEHRVYCLHMNSASDLMAQTGSTTKELIYQLVPVGEFTFGVVVALCLLGLIIGTVLYSARKVL